MRRTLRNFILCVAAVSAACAVQSCYRDPIFDEKSDYRIVISPLYDMLYDRPEKAPSMFRVLLYDPESHNLVSSNMVRIPL